MVATPQPHRGDLVECLDLVELDTDAAFGCAWSGLMVPDGWFVLSTEWDDANDDSHRDACIASGLDVVIVGRESHVMYSESRRIAAGEELWCVRTGGDADPHDRVVAEGTPPPEFQGIYQAHLEKQQEADRLRDPVGWLYEVPEQTARVITGYQLEDEYTKDFPERLYSYYRRQRSSWLTRLLR